MAESAVLYLDASALVKLLRQEVESDALRVELERWQDRVSSDVAEVEIRRTARRIGQSRSRADQLLSGVTLLALDETVRALAADVGSPSLRSLDAIHLATAMTLGSELGGFCCYDRRLAEDAEGAGLTVVAPGAAS